MSDCEKCGEHCLDCICNLNPGDPVRSYKIKVKVVKPPEIELIKFFNRKGEEICMSDWSYHMEDVEYRIVRKTCIGPYIVSTVWFGIWQDIMFSYITEPQMYETRIFNDESFSVDLDILHLCVKSGSEEMAILNHEFEVIKLLRRIPELEKEKRYDYGEGIGGTEGGGK